MIKPGLNSLDSMFLVPGEEAEFETTKDVPHGEVRAVWYRSGTLEMPRRMHVYTPPGYEGGQEKYPVLYLLHGGGDEDSGWSTIGRAGFILDNLIAAKKAVPMLVVMPNGSLPRPANLPAGPTARHPAVARGPGRDGGRPEPVHRRAAQGGRPDVEKTFRVKAGPENRALAGLSMGGGQTLRVLTTNPDRFAYVAIWSAGLFGGNAEDWEKRNEAFLAAADKVNGDGQAARDQRRRQGLRPGRLEGPGRGAGEARDQARGPRQRRRPHLDQLATLPQRAGPEALPVTPGARDRAAPPDGPPVRLSPGAGTLTVGRGPKRPRDGGMTPRCRSSWRIPEASARG